MKTPGCEDKNREHKFYAVDHGTVEGLYQVKFWAVMACTACTFSHLIEHVFDKTYKLSQKDKQWPLDKPQELPALTNTPVVRPK